MAIRMSKIQAFIITAVAVLAANAAHAANPVGNAAAYDFSVHVNLIGVTQLNVDAQTNAVLTNVTGDAWDGHQLPSFGISDVLSLINLSTGALSSEAEYRGGGMSAIAAKASVADLDLGAGVGAINVLSLGAGVITTSSSLAGSCPQALPVPKSLLDDFMFTTGFDFGNLHGGGDGGGGGGTGIGGLPPTGTGLVDPVISILGTSVPGLPAFPPANSTIDLGQLGIVGATLILNEQTQSGDGIHSLAIGTNGVHLTLNVAALVTAEVIIAHSEVSLACP